METTSRVHTPKSQHFCQVLASRDGCSPTGDISKGFTGHCSGLIFEGFNVRGPGRILSLRSSQSFLKPSKIIPHSPNAIDIALRGIFIPGESLDGTRRSFASSGHSSADPHTSRVAS